MPRTWVSARPSRAASSASRCSSCSAAPRRPAQVIIGNCFPGFPVLENRARRRAGGARRGSRAGVLGPVRRHCRPGIELRRVGVVARGQPRRRGPHRTVRPGPGEPRPAPGGQPGQRLHRRRLRPHRGQPGGDPGRFRRRGDRPDTLHAGLPAGVHAGRLAAQRHRTRVCRSSMPAPRSSPPIGSSSPSGCPS